MKPRIVLDTNVYVSRLLVAQSVSGRAVQRAWLDGITLVSAATLDELREVLCRPKFEKYIRPEMIEPYLEQI